MMDIPNPCIVPLYLNWILKQRYKKVTSHFVNQYNTFKIEIAKESFLLLQYLHIC